MSGAQHPEGRWAAITRSAEFLDPTGPEVVLRAQELGLDPDDCSGIYKEFTHGRRLLLMFEPHDAPGEFEPIHVDRNGVAQWGAD